MKVLVPDIPPIRFASQSFLKIFSELASRSNFLSATVAFISVDSILWLKENVELNRLCPLELVIGMHHFDGFTKSQYDATKDLAEILVQRKHGDVYICTHLAFHGKLYSFWSNSKPFAAIVGSSNLSSLVPSRIFEADIMLDEYEAVTEIARIQDEIKAKTAVRILDWKPREFRECPLPMPMVAGVERVPPSEVITAMSRRTDLRFTLPLKTEEKSNLNVYFGKGRENTRTGLIRPRPWYEVEIIVPSAITQQRGYPRNKSFFVITDDGWKFKVTTHGSNSKNLRSEDSLTILGAWIKGRLEAAGVIHVGRKIADEDMSRYGRQTVDLIATKDPNVWILDFSVT